MLAKIKKLGIGFAILWALAAISLVIYVISIFSTPFADFFTRYPAAFVRAALSYITYLLPISFAEIMLILLIPSAIFLLVIGCKYYCTSWKTVGIFTARVLAIASVLFSLFVFTLGTGYRTTTLDKRLGLTEGKVNADGVKYTAEVLVDRIKELEGEIEFGDDDFSVLPYSYDEMSKKLMAAYGKVCEKYDFIPYFESRVKPVMLSEPMTYTHIAGVYTYFTGESNINVTFPDYTLPYTAAHELAHQRGIAREDEANFIAFLVCSESDDPYIRYSGYVGLLDYVLNAFYRSDKSEGHADYKALYSSIPESVRAEQRAYSEFYKKYADNIVGDISGTVNNTYLQSQGTPGSVSYSLVVNLAVRYFTNP